MMLKGKTSVITGCNRGIGLSTLKNFAKNGSDIFACCRKISDEFANEIEKLSSENEVKISLIDFDLQDERLITEAAKRILNETNKVDVIVNNAGMAQGGLFQMTKKTALNEVFEVNFFSQLSFTQALVRNMIKHKQGSIINIGSTAGLIGDKGTVAYGSSKAALMYASRVLANEVGAFNIRVNSVAPGITLTDMANQLDEKSTEKALSSIPLKRFAEPHEIANVITFLASDLSSYLTGQIIRVDGGFV